MKFRCGLSLCLAALLIVAVGSAVVNASFTPTKRFHGKLTDVVPSASDVPKWRVVFQAATNSIELRRLEKETLQYDEAVYVDYIKDNTRISLYLVYWSPGKTSSQWVASHTPDVCWIQQGWECLNRSRWPFKLTNAQAGSFALEFRTFSWSGQTEHVAFGHFEDERIITYSGVGKRPSRSRDFLKRIQTLNFRPRNGEQLFLRISSNQPFETIEDSAPLAALRSAFDQLEYVRHIR